MTPPSDTTAPHNPDAGEMPDAADLAYPLNPDSPHCRHLVAEGKQVAFYVVNVIGRTADYVDQLIPTAKSVLKQQDLIPVFMTDLLDYRMFRKHGVIFESVPPIAESARILPGIDWQHRQAECIELVTEKWCPSGVAELSGNLPEPEVS